LACQSRALDLDDMLRWKQVLYTVGIAVALHAVFTIGIPWMLLDVTKDVRWLVVSLGPLRWVGVGLILAGAYLYIAIVARLLSRNTSALPGQSPKVLETNSWYGHVRHPLLLGVVLILIGEAMAAQSLILLGYAVIYWVWLNFFVARYEEPELRATFGEAYASYCRDVPRWIPRLTRYKGADHARRRA